MSDLIGGCDGEIRSVVSAPSLSCFFYNLFALDLFCRSKCCFTRIGSGIWCVEMIRIL
jgi:hypothetical protein